MYHRHGCHIMLTRKRRSVSIVCSYDHPQFQVTDLCWKRGREVYCIGMPVSHVARLAEPGAIHTRTRWEEYAELGNALRICIHDAPYVTNELQLTRSFSVIVLARSRAAA